MYLKRVHFSVLKTCSDFLKFSLRRNQKAKMHILMFKVSFYHFLSSQKSWLQKYKMSQQNVNWIPMTSYSYHRRIEEQTQVQGLKKLGFKSCIIGNYELILSFLISNCILSGSVMCGSSKILEALVAKIMTMDVSSSLAMYQVLLQHFMYIISLSPPNHLKYRDFFYSCFPD